MPSPREPSAGETSVVQHRFLARGPFYSPRAVGFDRAWVDEIPLHTLSGQDIIYVSADVRSGSGAFQRNTNQMDNHGQITDNPDTQGVDPSGIDDDDVDHGSQHQKIETTVVAPMKKAGIKQETIDAFISIMYPEPFLAQLDLQTSTNLAEVLFNACAEALRELAEDLPSMPRSKLDECFRLGVLDICRNYVEMDVPVVGEAAKDFIAAYIKAYRSNRDSSGRNILTGHKDLGTEAPPPCDQDVCHDCNKPIYPGRQ